MIEAWTTNSNAIMGSLEDSFDKIRNKRRTSTLFHLCSMYYERHYNTEYNFTFY